MKSRVVPDLDFLNPTTAECINTNPAAARASCVLHEIRHFTIA